MIIMPETITTREIYDELRELRKEIEFIRSHMFDPDTIMTTEEANGLNRA